jgi:hypothetical protein
LEFGIYIFKLWQSLLNSKIEIKNLYFVTFKNRLENKQYSQDDFFVSIALFLKIEVKLIVKFKMIFLKKIKLKKRLNTSKTNQIRRKTINIT